MAGMYWIRRSGLFYRTGWPSDGERYSGIAAGSESGVIDQVAPGRRLPGRYREVDLPKTSPKSGGIPDTLTTHSIQPAQ